MTERNFTILDRTITVAESITVVERGIMPGGITGLTASAVFTVGGGGTTAKAFIQTSLDEGATWIDIMCLAFTTSTARKVATVSSTTPLITGVPVDGALADNTILDGVVGTMLRAKYVTTGTYTATTTLKVDIKLHN